MKDFQSMSKKVVQNLDIEMQGFRSGLAESIDINTI